MGNVTISGEVQGEEYNCSETDDLFGSDGEIYLDQILNIDLIPGLINPIHSSPLFLYRFDRGKEGSINRNDLYKFVRHVQSGKKKLSKLKKRKIGSSVWKTVGRDDLNDIDISRSSPTPAFTHMDKDSSEDLADEDDQIKLIEYALMLEATRFFDKVIKSENGKNDFIEWLWNLADFKNNDEISLEELSVMLVALDHDGIDPNHLLFESEIVDNINLDYDYTRLAQKILTEYDIGQTGYLTKNEFFLLANLILKNYKAIRDLEEYGDQIGPYDIIRKIGEGSSGEVVLATHQITFEKRAIKIIKKKKVADYTMLDTEIKAMLMITHLNVANLELVLESSKNVYLIMEYCDGGTLAEYIKYKPFGENLARYFFKQIMAGVTFCHREGICHRDLKLDNILLGKNFTVKITDFGHAGIFSKGWDLFSTPLVGGMCHVAPEQLSGILYSGKKNDVWSLGVILYTLLTGRVPFIGNTHQDLFQNIMNATYLPIEEHISEEAKHLINGMLMPNLELRYSSQDVANHPWTTSKQIEEPNMSGIEIQIDSKDINIFQRLDEEGVHLREVTTNLYECQFPEIGAKFILFLNNNKLSIEIKQGGTKDLLTIIVKIKNLIRSPEPVCT